MRIAFLVIFLFAVSVVGCQNVLPYRSGDLSVIKRASREFQNLKRQNAICGVGEDDRVRVNFYMLRGQYLDQPYLSADIKVGISNNNEVCVGDYIIGSAAYRAIFSADDPAVLLGVFRRDNGRWRVCVEDEDGEQRSGRVGP